MCRPVAALYNPVKRALCLAALVSGLAIPVQAQNQDGGFEQRVIDTILANPEVVLKALEIIRDADTAKKEDTEREKIERVSGDLFAPDPETGVVPTVVEFFDYMCGFCAVAAKDVRGVSEKHPGRVRLVEYPILGDVSTGLASIALGVKDIYGRETYETFHYTLMAALGAKRTEQGARSILEDMGLNVDLVLARAASTEVSDEIARNHQIGRALGVDGTPAFMTSTKLHGGMLTRQQLDHMMKQGS